MSDGEDLSFASAGESDARVPMIDFRGADGTCYALAYADLLSVILTSSQMIVMEFRDHRVLVRGRNLTPVYRGLVAHRIAFLREDDFDVSPESETFVDSLTITREPSDKAPA